jgi:hypothetical protein
MDTVYMMLLKRTPGGREELDGRLDGTWIDEDEIPGSLAHLAS